VIDGELLAFKDERVLSFNQLQTRIGRKNVTAKIREETPVVLFAYDLLEYYGEDLRSQPLSKRRELLEMLVVNTGLPVLRLSAPVPFTGWDELHAARAAARDLGSEGLMLKRKDAAYGTGRKKGDWWKWKLDPYSIDAVMIYAQSGHGRRANLFTDYTFAVWDAEGKLVPFAKAYSGLTDKEIKEVDAWVKKNTLEKFGPVRSVAPELVFEIGFEGINKSSRHKSGIALRFPRILRWRKDKKKEEADTLGSLKNLLLQASGGTADNEIRSAGGESG
jgi:DNA ligase-1